MSAIRMHLQHLFMVCLVLTGEHTLAVADDAARILPTDIRRWLRHADATRLTDFSLCHPVEALVTGPRKPGCWKVIPYATANWEGQALSAFQDTQSRDVTLPLQATGWHAVYVGICTVSGGLDKAETNGIMVKLSGNSVYKRMSNALPLLKPRRDQIQEVFLDVADVTGQSLDIRAYPHRAGTLCAVTLVPLTTAEVAAWQAERARTTGRNVIATFDGHSWVWPYRPRTKEDLLGTFRGFEGTDVGKWWFQVCGADLVCYPSDVGNIPGEGTEDFSRWEYREYTESLQKLFAVGVNPLRVARDEATRQGVEFHVFIRPTGWKGSFPWDEIFNSRFFESHPEWRCIDRDGTPTLHLSYAFPEVRQQVLAILKESLAVDPDGVGFLFHRGMPMVLWEQPFLDAFTAKYGVDARTIPEDDCRILNLRAEYMTGFLTEVRTLLDQEAKLGGRTTPYKMSLSTFSTEKDNRKFGLDVARWIKEGLVDDLAVAYFAHHTSFGPPDMAYYKRLTIGTAVGLYPFVIAWHSGKPQELCAKATAFYKAGATGIAVWDSVVEGTYRDGSPGHVFDVTSRLGQRELIADWAEHGVPLPQATPLTRFADNHYSRWFPNTGF